MPVNALREHLGFSFICIKNEDSRKKLNIPPPGTGVQNKVVFLTSYNIIVGNLFWFTRLSV